MIVARVSEEKNPIINISFSDITTRKNAETKLIYQNTHDHLTGLNNRLTFEEKLIALDSERRLPVTIIVADVDRLKKINDEFGHPEGDKLIITVANLLRTNFRDDAFEARIGGDEFVIIVPINNDEAQKHISQINKLCENIKTVNDNKLSISMGAATKTSSDQNIYDIFKQADKNMYEVKNERKKNL